jgi:hypothetical protein
MYVDRNEAIKRIRIALKKRTGKSWSVTGGRGTAWGWITVQAPPKRRVDHEQSSTWDRTQPDKPLFTEIGPPPGENGLYTSLEDCEELAEIFSLDKPHIHMQSLSISPDNNEYYVYLAENGRKPEPTPPPTPEPIDIIAEATEIVVKVETETAVTKMITAINTILDKSDPGQALNALIESGFDTLDAMTILQEIIAEREANIGKIKAVKFTINWSEWGTKEPLIFDGWRTFNIQLKQIANDHARRYGKSGNYYKTSFTVEWADGHTHEGRLDVNGTDDHNLGEHILSYFQFFGGLIRPDWMDDAKWERHLTQIEATKQGFVDFLDSHEVIV